MVKVHVVDLKSETIASPISVRAYLNQTITEFKQLIAQVSYYTQFLHCIFVSLSSSCSFSSSILNINIENSSK